MRKILLIAILILGLGAYSAQAETVGLWLFDETGGPIAQDSTTYGNDGTIYDAIRVSDTPFAYTGNQAMSFDGLGDYINCGNNPILRPTSAFTLEAWVKPESVGYRYIADSAERFLLKLNTNDQYPLASIRRSIDANPDNDSYYNLVSDIPIPLDVWSHVASTYDGTYLRLYINGQLHGETLLDSPLSPAGTNPSDNFIIGDHALIGYFAQYYWHGLIDEMRVSDVALSPEQLGYHQSLSVKPEYELSLNYGETVSGDVYVTMTYRDIPSPWFYFKVDGADIRSNPWKTQYFSNGPHTVYGRYYDWEEGKLYDSNPITVIVDNATSYAPQIKYPFEGSVVSDDVSIYFIANRSEAYFARIYADDEIIGWQYISGTSSQLYSFVWQTKIANGQYDLRVVVYYQNGGYVVSSPVSVTVNNPDPPAVNMVCPDTVSGIANAHIYSNDNNTFVFPSLYVDSNLVGVKFYMPCDISWNTSNFTNGAHTLRVLAYHQQLRGWFNTEKVIEVQN